MISNFHAVLKINRLFLKHDGSAVTNCWFSPIIGSNNTKWPLSRYDVHSCGTNLVYRTTFVCAPTKSYRAPRILQKNSTQPLGVYVASISHQIMVVFTQEHTHPTSFQGCVRKYKPRVVTMELWKLKWKCSKAIPKHFQNLVVWSRALKFLVKSYAIKSSTKCQSNEFSFMWVLTHDKIE